VSTTPPSVNTSASVVSCYGLCLGAKPSTYDGGPLGFGITVDEHTDDHTSHILWLSFGCPLALYFFPSISE
jgi:hypothetical protein